MACERVSGGFGRDAPIPELHRRLLFPWLGKFSIFWANVKFTSQTRCSERDIIPLMMIKAQHNTAYKKLLSLLKKMREDSGLSQRALSRKLRKPQNWVFKIETSERRIDIVEFAAWAAACEGDPISIIKVVAKFCD